MKQWRSAPHRQPQPNVYTNTNGVEVVIRALSLVELQLAQAGLRGEMEQDGVIVSAPQYEYEVFGGGTETRDHDETTLQTDEDKAAWSAYQAGLRAFDRANTQLMQEIVFEDGLIAEPNEAWEARCKRRHIAIPSDPDEKRLQYILTALLPTPDDIKACISAVLLLSAKGLDNQAELEAALAGFRGELPAEPELDGTGEAVGGPIG